MIGICSAGAVHALTRPSMSRYRHHWRDILRYPTPSALRCPGDATVHSPPRSPARKPPGTARIVGLQAKPTQKSSNSALPPSSDGPHVNPAPTRPSSDRNRDGPDGHVGPSGKCCRADEVHDHKPARRHRCRTMLTGDGPRPDHRQGIDLPVRLRPVVHQRRHTFTGPTAKRRPPPPRSPSRPAGSARNSRQRRRTQRHRSNRQAGHPHARRRLRHPDVAGQRQPPRS